MKKALLIALLALPLTAAAECELFDIGCQRQAFGFDQPAEKPELMDLNEGRSGAGPKPIAPTPPIGAKNCQQVQVQDAYGNWRWVSVCD